MDTYKKRKKNWKKPLSLLLALCLVVGLFPALTAPARAAEEVYEVQLGDVVYTNQAKDGGTYFNAVRPIRAAEGVTEVTIPSTVSFTTTVGGAEKTLNNIRVTVPDGDLPKNSPALKVLDISQLDYLTEQTFKDCTNLTKVILPPQATEIPWGFFQGCTGLTEVVFPENLTTISSGCFQGCTGLKSIDLPDGLTKLDVGCFADCTGLTAITLPDSVTTIGWDCFQGCTGLADVVLPKGLTAIPDGCFRDCTSLTGITLPDTVIEIGINAFNGSGLTGITLPEGLKTLQAACFYGTPMTDLTIPAGVTTLHAIFAPYGGGIPKAAEGLKITFMGTDLSGIDAPKGISTIPSSATVFLQPDTAAPDWMKWNTVETVDADIPPYRLEVTNSADGQLDLGDFTVRNGSFEGRLILSVKNTGTDALSGLKVEVKTSAPHGRLSDPTRTELKPNDSAAVEFFPNTDLTSGAYTDDLTITTDQLTFNLKIKYTIHSVSCFSVTPAALDFGTVYAGYDQPEAQTLTVTAGDHGVSLNPSNLPEHFTCALGKTQLAKGESATVTIRPKADLAAGTYKEWAGIQCGEHRSGRGIELQFTVKAKPNFVFSVTEMDFGQGKVGFRPQAQTVNVTNAGSSMAAITKATLSGDGFEYTRKLAGGYEISGGNTIEEIVGVRPKEGLEDGTYTGELVFDIEDGSKYTIPLKYVVSGKSVLTASPNKLDFGAVTEGDYTQPAAQTVTLKNEGKDPVTLNAPTSTDYDLGAFSRTTLAAGQTATFTIRPKAGLPARGYADTVTVTTAQGDTAVVFLSFKVTEALSASPNKLDFGAVEEGYAQPDPQTVTLTNGGDASVTLQAPTSANYVLGTLSRTTLAAGQSATFTIRPKAELKAGSYTEQIVIKTAQGGSAAVSVNFKVENNGLTFTDVKESDWFYADVEYAFENGLMNGVGGGRFNPNGTTTRGQIVTILYRLEGEPSVSGASTFADVAAGAYYAKAVKWASDHNIVNGYSSTSFGPNDPITREQMAAILYRYAGYKNYNVAARADLSKFTDAGSISRYAVDALSWANDQGLINGVTGTTIKPQGSATRAQVAAILHRFCEKIAQ